MPSVNFERLIGIVRALREPKTGCPWDLEQTHATLRPYVIEECYEVLEAIERGDDVEFATELGDLLLQVVLHAQIAAERGAFTIDDVARRVADKMVARHPHVFGEVKVRDSEEVLRNWEALKLKEHAAKNLAPSEVSPLLGGVPKGMPALLRAHRLGEKAAKVGFDWRDVSGVWEKVEEEVAEVEEELRSPLAKGGRQVRLTDEDRRAVGHEIGDLLFALTQLSRWLGLSAEDLLHRGCNRFVGRFSAMEKLSPETFSELSEDRLEELWQQAKKSQG